ncbi:lipocalin family protein [Lentibacter sp.]|uniref:lipocalin family protein n=1 Tax=Lentibacter sp. TaxID=2024994 RepID=UPI003F69537F
MRPGWLLAASLALAGCVPVSVPEAAFESYRDSAVMIASTLRFDLARFEGDWAVRGAYPNDHLQRVTIKARGARRFVWRSEGRAAQGEVTGPGRFRLAGQAADYWVLWVDEDFRTAVIGTPDGRFGLILDRKAGGGADRIQAAREMLEFNGYDLGQMVMRP